MMWGWQGGYGWGPMWGFGWIIPVVIVVGLVWLMIRLSRMTHGQRGDRALHILRERYAKGELSKEEFDRMRQELGA
jgi:putative membrane protein